LAAVRWLFPVSVVAAAVVAGCAAAAVTTRVVPLKAERAIKEHVPLANRYVPTWVPAEWRYFSWDSGNGTPGRGSGLNIWFTTPNSYQPCGSLGCTPHSAAGPGFHVFADSHCSLKGAMQTFRIAGVRVAWSATFEDAQAWRCIAQPGRAAVNVSVSSVGMGNDPRQIVEARAHALAETVASARLIR
jgi:hypothetical protein